MRQQIQSRPDIRAIEDEYRVQYLDADKRQVSLGMGLWAAGIFLFSAADFYAFHLSTRFTILVVLRILFAGLSVAGVYWIKKRIKDARSFDTLIQGWTLACAAILIVISLSRPLVGTAIFIIDLVAIVSLYAFVPNRLPIRLLAPLLVTAYDLGLASFGNTSVLHSTMQALTFSYLATNILGVLLTTRLDTFRRNEYAAHREEWYARQELERLASTDPLTGVYNRRRLLELAGDAFYRFKRYSRPFSILLMDMDGFKMVNDTFGHQQGDQVLIQFSQMVCLEKRAADALGRMGGDEFCLVLPETPPQSASVMAQRILSHCCKLEPNGNALDVNVTVSIGVSQVLPEDTSIDHVFSRADAALYLAKNNGRNRCEISN
jgi:diguanylate cyclase (GGDEF)-like protein